MKKYLFAIIGLILSGQLYGLNKCGESGHVSTIYLENHTNIPVIGNSPYIYPRGPIAGPGEQVVLSCDTGSWTDADEITYHFKGANYHYKSYTHKNILATTTIDIKIPSSPMFGPMVSKSNPNNYNYAVLPTFSDNHTTIRIYLFPYPKKFNINIANYSPWQFSVNGNNKGSVKPTNSSGPTHTGVTPKIQTIDPGSQYSNTVKISSYASNKATITNKINLPKGKHANVASNWQIPTEEIVIYNSLSDIMIGASKGSGLNFDISLFSNDGHPTKLQFNAFNNLTHYNDFWLTQTNPIKNIQSTSLDQKHTDGVIYPGLFCNLYAPTCTLSWEITGAIGLNKKSGTPIAVIKAKIDTSQAKSQANFKSSQYKPVNNKDITYPQNSDGSRKYPYAISVDVDNNASNMDISLNPYPNNFYISIVNKTDPNTTFKVYPDANQEEANIFTKLITYYPSVIPLAQKQNNGVTYQDTYIIENTTTGDTAEIPVTIHQDEPGDLSSWSITNQLPKIIKLGNYIIKTNTVSFSTNVIVINITGNSN